MRHDPSDIERFTAAQEPVFASVRSELKDGAKVTHWMWFIFPQLRGLGQSEAATFYGIDGRGEAQRYAAHPVLGLRLAEVCDLMLEHEGRSAAQILGPVDAMKLRSSATLFSETASDPVRFRNLLAVFHDGVPCDATLALLKDPA